MFAAIALALAIAAHYDDAPTGRRVALFVGINSYDKPAFADLAGAENDAKALAAEFGKLGFETTVATGANGPNRATLANLRALIKKTVAGLTKRDVLVVGLAGHGVQAETKNAAGAVQTADYFCPVDAVPRDASTLLPLEETLADIGANVGKGLLIVDACRNVTEDPTRSGGIAGRMIALPQGMSILFSCSSGQRSKEHPRRPNGLFTACLLDALAEIDGEVEWLALASKTAARMDSPTIRSLDAAAEQTPVLVSNVSRAVLGRRTADRTSAATRVPSRETPATREQPTFNASTKKPLRWQFPVGRVDVYEVTIGTTVTAALTAGAQTMSANTGQSNSMTISHVGEPPSPGAAFSFRKRLDRMAVTQRDMAGNVMQWDSARADAQNNPIGAFLSRDVGGIISYDIGEDFKASAVRGIEDLQARYSDAPGNVQNAARQRHNAASYLASTSNELSMLPDRAVAPGDSWTQQFNANLGLFGTVTGTVLFTYIGPQGDLDRISVVLRDPRVVNASPQAGQAFNLDRIAISEVRGSGELLFDSKRGRVQRFTQLLRVGVSVGARLPNGQQVRGGGVVEYRTARKLLDSSSSSAKSSDAPSGASKPVELAWRFESGRPMFLYDADSQLVEFDFTRNPGGGKPWISRDTTQVLKLLPERRADGGWDFRIRVEGNVIKNKASTGATQQYDSYRNFASDDGIRQEGARLLGVEWTIRCSSVLSVESVEGTDAILTAKYPELAGDARDVAARQFDGMMRDLMAGIGELLPGRAVAPGAQWRGRVTGNTLFGIYRGSADLTYRGSVKTGDQISMSAHDLTFEGEPRQNLGSIALSWKHGDVAMRSNRGSATFDRRSGRIARIDADYTFSGSVTAESNGVSIPAPVKVTYGQILQFLDSDPLKK